MTILNDFIIFSPHIDWLYNLAPQFDAILLYFSICFMKVKGRIVDWLSMTEKIELMLDLYVLCIKFC